MEIDQDLVEGYNTVLYQQDGDGSEFALVGTDGGADYPVGVSWQSPSIKWSCSAERLWWRVNLTLTVGYWREDFDMKGRGEKRRNGMGWDGEVG
jgi:hypothetical protein